MTKQQFKKLRKSIGYSQTRLAIEMGVTLRTISRWETGEFPIPLIAELALETVVRDAKKKPIPWEKIKKELGLKGRPKKH
jgi:transcriptional regulator with XRE-family HTH domain